MTEDFRLAQRFTSGLPNSRPEADRFASGTSDNFSPPKPDHGRDPA
jgi:hypothetical protein